MRIAKSLVGAATAICMALPAAAATMDIIGTPGAGFVTITLDGTTNPRANGTIRDTSANNFRDTSQPEDSFELAGYIIDTGIQDMIYATTGDLRISFNGNTAPIDGIFLDHDTALSATAAAYSDFGFRSDTGLTYSVLPGQDLIFAGTGTIPVDITAFETPLAQTASFSTNMFASNEFQVTITAVPILPALPALIAGLGALGLVARRRRA